MRRLAAPPLASEGGGGSPRGKARCGVWGALLFGLGCPLGRICSGGSMAVCCGVLRRGCLGCGCRLLVCGLLRLLLVVRIASRCCCLYGVRRVGGCSSRGGVVLCGCFRPRVSGVLGICLAGLLCLGSRVRGRVLVRGPLGVGVVISGLGYHGCFGMRGGSPFSRIRCFSFGGVR